MIKPTDQCSINFDRDKIKDQDINVYNDNLHRTLNTIAELTIPKPSGKITTHKYNPWWNEECSEV